MEWGGPRAHAVTLVQGSCTSWQWHWNVTQVETVEALGQSRCTVTGSHGCWGRAAWAEKTASRRVLAQLCPGRRGENQAWKT